MGLILDSSVLIAAERQGRNARQALAEIALRAAGEDVAVSVNWRTEWLAPTRLKEKPRDGSSSTN